ncbi:MAG: serine/threonine-protein kinase [Vicinamibacterales bacterium]
MSGSADITVVRSEADASGSAARFTPGQVIGGRYRMVSLLGRGGMGEVYRADDLVLGTPVALKFLPDHLAGDSIALERLRGEVRIARQVSHPHVCRVFDVGDIDGRQFLSMEFVDGEDLATLLRRIGRLPLPKALELSRQLCAGLGAAHQQGVLHRDLKPANVMVDGHGRIRITDFGLAVAGTPVTREFAGTPAYMAPEQLSGEPATTRSDIYALGLVLYEIFTGTRTFAADTLEGWRRTHAESQPESLRTHVGDIDPVVERVILSCLAKDPTSRPSSASQVALALPGGDPLALAIAAGETPSPAMVAAAGGAGLLTRRMAWTLLSATLVALAGVTAITPYSTDLGLAPMTRSPDVLQDRAQEVVRRFGYDAPARDETSWIERDYEFLRWMADHMSSVEWRARLAQIGPPVVATYRRSGVPIVAQHVSGLITATTPALSNGADDIVVELDGAARLRSFVASPPSWRRGPPSPVVTFDEVLTAAGLELARFTEVEPRFTPLMPFDVRREWEGTRGDIPEVRWRVSVAWFGGHLVSAVVLGPWSELSTRSLDAVTSFRVQQAALALFILAMLAVIVELGRRNLRAGRGDRRGALRVAAVAGGSSVIVGLLTTHLASGTPFAPVDLVFSAWGQAGSIGLVMWLAYVAIEPFGRRHVPSLMVGWARLLEGRVHDSGVHRELLLGLTCGTWMALLLHLTSGLPTVAQVPGETPIAGFTVLLRAGGVFTRFAPTAAVVAAGADALLQAFWLFAMVVGLRAVTRPPVAVVVTALVGMLLTLGGENAMLEAPLAVVMGIALAWAANHGGLLTLVVLVSTFRLAGQSGMVGVSPTLWYGPHSWAVLAALAALAVWAFRGSTRSQPGFDRLGPTPAV